MSAQRPQPLRMDAESLLLSCVAALPAGDAALAQLAALCEAAPSLSAVVAAALDLVDRECVACVSAPSGRSIYIVTPPAPLRAGAAAAAAPAGAAPPPPPRERMLAPVRTDFCPCRVFAETCLAAPAAPAVAQCAHILAVHVALAVGAVAQRMTSDEELIALLCG